MINWGSVFVIYHYTTSTFTKGNNIYHSFQNKSTVQADVSKHTLSFRVLTLHDLIPLVSYGV